MTQNRVASWQNAYPTLTNFEAQTQLIQESNDAGTVTAPNTAGLPFAPYVLKIPVTPNTDDNTIGNGPVGTSDWCCNEANGDLRTNDSAVTRAFWPTVST